MDQPLGRAVGNALEIKEARATLAGEGPDDFTELVLRRVGAPARAVRPRLDEQEGRTRAEAAVDDGSALERYERWISAQGGDPSEDVLPRAPVVRPVAVAGVGLRRGNCGAPRRHRGARARRGTRTKDDAIDHAVGVVCFAQARRPRSSAASRSPRSTRATTTRQPRPPSRSALIEIAYELGAAPIVLETLA